MSDHELMSDRELMSDHELMSDVLQKMQQKETHQGEDS